MKLCLNGAPAVIMSNPFGKAGYFGWPSISLLQNGKIAVVASGYRHAHICPFGKAVISFSEDGGKSYTPPAPVIDTPLDDRDAGILAFGKSSVLVTSFNNTIKFQRDFNNQKNYQAESGFRGWADKELVESYLATVTPEEEERYLGAEFRISENGGVTFGKLYKSPITSPHGPICLKDGTVLWVGRTFNPADTFRAESDEIQAHRIHPDGSMSYVGRIPPFYRGGHKVLSCEPYAVELPNGRLLCHIRVQEDGQLFSLCQSVSDDKGATWSEPEQILSDFGGAPAHLFVHSSGVLVSVYGYREKPYGILAMFSHDNGKTWDTGHRLYTGVNGDLGYPCSAELADGTILTVFYAHPTPEEKALILQQTWRIEL